MASLKVNSEELVPRIETAIVVLKELRESHTMPEEKARLTNKIEGMELILNARREQFQNMRTPREVATIACLLSLVAEEKHAEAVKMVQGYMVECCAE